MLRYSKCSVTSHRRRKWKLARSYRLNKPSAQENLFQTTIYIKPTGATLSNIRKLFSTDWMRRHVIRRELSIPLQYPELIGNWSCQYNDVIEANINVLSPFQIKPILQLHLFLFTVSTALRRKNCVAKGIRSYLSNINFCVQKFHTFLEKAL